MVADRRIKVTEIAEEIHISRERIEEILHHELGLSKRCARWVPRLLTREQKEFRAQCSISLVHMFDEDPEGFRFRYVSGDETWIFCYDPELKRASMQWLPIGGRGPVKALKSKSKMKQMMTLFFDFNGPLLIDCCH